MISLNSGPKRHRDNQALYEKEYGNKRIRRSESYGETSCSKLSYDIPYKNISLDMARPGRDCHLYFIPLIIACCIDCMLLEQDILHGSHYHP
nr:hypothetical protein [Tanacetum cinerariifolium]